MSGGWRRFAAGADVLGGDGAGQDAVAFRLERFDDPLVECRRRRGRP